MWEHLHSKVSHSVLAVEVLVLSFHHYVESLEQKRIKEVLHVLLGIVLSELLEFFGLHAHQSSSVLTCEVNENGFGEIADFGCYHVSWLISQESLSAVFAFETGCVFDDLSSAVVTLASWIINSLIVLDS